MPSPLRIALVHVADKGGGAERSVLTLHQSLLAMGHDSRLYVGRNYLHEPGVIQIPQEQTVPGLLRITRRLEEGWGLQNLYAPWFRNLHKQIGEADVVHFHSLWKSGHAFADLTGIANLSKRYPTLMTLRDGWMMTGHCACPIGCDRWKIGCGRCPDLERAPGIRQDWTATNWKRKQRTIQKSPLHVTTVSTWLKRQVESSPIFTGKPVRVVHNSVDADVFCPGDSEQARRALGINRDSFVVLLAGQSIEGIHQNISQHAVQALNTLGDQGIVTLLVGRSASAVAKTLHTPSIQVPFRETPAEMAECYRAADLTLVPSEYETFGRVAAESLACGTPVLAFATGGLTDIVEDGVCGRLVPTGDTIAFKQALEVLKASPQVLRAMRSKCSESARQRFSTEKIAAEYLDAYAEVMQIRRHRHAALLQVPSVIEAAASPVRISCVIPAFNCEQWLCRAVESVFATHYPNLEVLIVDDGSSDATLQVAQEIQSNSPDIVRVLQHPGSINRGVSATRNLGMSESTGEWLCFLDADDYVHPHRFDSAAEILGSRPDVDGVHQIAEMVFSDAESRDRWFQNQPTFGFSQEIPADQLLEQLLRGKCWATSAITFRRTLLNRTGLFNENLSIAEDCHLWFRMATTGRIVSGDLSRPVSAYWRRTNSAYQPSSESRMKMIKSMASFLRWMRTADCSSEARASATRCVQNYILTGLTESRFSRKRFLAWRIAIEGVRGMPSLILNRRYCGQVARLAAGR